mgnify:CR=1 FL=1
MPRRQRLTLQDNHERWLVSYADFITLLFAFFVVMYSISQVSESKYRVLSETLVEAFRPARSLEPIQVGQPSRSPSASAIDIRGDWRGDTEQPELGDMGALAAEDLGDLEQLAQRLETDFSELIKDELLTVRANEYWLQVELRDSILFESGSAELSARAQAIFSDLAKLLQQYGNQIQVEGHTDNVPISNLRYPSNWELSAARASAIVKLLVIDGLSPDRLSAVGYGEYQPLVGNDSEDQQARNRRVALMIARQNLERPTQPLQTEGAEPVAVEAAADTAPVVSETAETLGAEAADRESRQSVDPVELEGGGLLFSSDPELPRQAQ